MRKNFIINILPYFICMVCLSISFAYGADQPKTFGYDYYLGFPVADPTIQKFFKQNHIIIRPYYKMDTMVKDLASSKLAAAFMPAGTKISGKQQGLPRDS